MTTKFMRGWAGVSFNIRGSAHTEVRGKFYIRTNFFNKTIPPRGRAMSMDSVPPPPPSVHEWRDAHMGQPWAPAPPPAAPMRPETYLKRLVSATKVTRKTHNRRRL